MTSLKLSNIDMPNIVRLELSNTCNLQCPHCRHHSPDKKESDDYPDFYKTPKHMTESQVLGIMEEISPYKPSITLNVANEPTIAPTFQYAIKVIKEKNLSATFNSNGVKFTKEIAHLLVDTKFDSINISIDAIKSETLKLARGFTNLEKLKRNIDMLLEVRGAKAHPRIGVTFVITDYNEDELPEFLEYWKKKVDVIRITGYISDDNPDLSQTPSADVNHICGFEKTSLPPRVPCKQLFRDIVIRSNGDVTPCVITSEKPDGPIVGNIFRDGGVAGVWNSDKFKELRELHSQGRWDEIDFCKDCDYWVETNSMRETETDDFLIRSPSPYTAFFNVKEKLSNWNKELHDRQGNL